MKKIKIWILFRIQQYIYKKYTVNINLYPEYRSVKEWWSVYCHRNHLVASVWLEIGALMKHIEKID